MGGPFTPATKREQAMVEVLVTALHGLEHFSPSSLNLWAAEPALFILERLLKRTGKVGAAAHRGTATEAGVAKALLEGVDADAAADHAVAEYRRLTALSGDKNRDKEGEAVPGCTREALNLLRYAYLNQPVESYQRRVEWYDPVHLPLPIIGFCDFEFPGEVVDLKTQLRLASSISAGHARQVALYSKATNKPASLLYATPKAAALYQLDEPAKHFDALVKIGQSLVRFLNVSSDPQELAGLISPNFESFYWSDPVTRAAGREVWGF